jgi:IS5 family transposase
MRSFPSNPYDGHTLKEALEQVEILTDQRPDLAVVDRGYRGHGETRTGVLISGTRRGLTPKLIADLRRQSAIEAEIGHMKTDGRLSRCPLKATIGDAVFAVLCACGHNIRKILAHLRACLDCRRHSQRTLPPRSPVSARHLSLNGLFKANNIDCRPAGRYQ